MEKMKTREELTEFCREQNVKGWGLGFRYEPMENGDIHIEYNGKTFGIADENLKLHTKYIYFANGEMKKEAR